MNPSPYVARPVIPLLLCLVTGMVLGHELTGHTILPLLTAIFSFVMVIRAICIKRNGLFFSLLFFISLGYLLIQKPYDLEQRLTSNKHIRSYAEQGDVFLLGTVHTNPEPTKRDQTFILDSIVVQGEQDLVTEVQGKLSSKFEVHRAQIIRWKQEAVTALPDFFSNQKDRKNQDHEKLIDELYKQIGQLKVENDWLKKKS